MDLENVLRERAKIFDTALNGNLTHRDPRTFYEALRWIPLSGGKRLRPIITMLSCEAVGGVPETTIPLGVALEYMHNSTLIHDDIVDRDKWRRSLEDLRREAEKGKRQNLVPAVIECCKADATKGEILGLIRQAYDMSYDPFNMIESPL